MSDFLFVDHGSLCILTPRTPETSEWVEQHISPDALYWGGGVVIEPRYVAAILEGLQADGLTVE